MFKKINLGMRYLKLIPKTLIPYSLLAISASFASMLSIILFAGVLQIFVSKIGFTNPQNFQNLIPEYFYDQNIKFIFLVILTVIFHYLILFIDNFLNIIAKEKFVFEIKRLFFRNIFILNEISLGQSSTMISETIPRAGEFFYSLLSTVNRFIILVFICGYIFFNMPKEFTIFIFFLILTLPLLFYFIKILKSKSVKILNYSEVYNKEVTDSIKNLLFIKIIGKENFFLENIFKNLKNYFKEFITSNFIYSLANSIFNAMILIFIFVYFLSYFQNDTSGESIILFYLFYRLSAIIVQVVSNTNSLSVNSIFFEKVFQISFSDSEVKLNSSLNVEHINNIELQDVSHPFIPSSKKNLLSLKINRGEILNIRGNSGSGKSTLISLCLGFNLKSYHGDILINNNSINNIDLKTLRTKVGYVGAEPFLINGTVIENIKYGVPYHIDDKILKQAMEISQCDEFIKNNDDLTKIISDQGLGLSMGQKQRICLARALVNKPEILILDEMTANLDSENENKIIQQMVAYKKDLIIITSSHSIKFSNIADKEIFLSD